LKYTLFFFFRHTKCELPKELNSFLEHNPNLQFTVHNTTVFLIGIRFFL